MEGPIDQSELVYHDAQWPATAPAGGILPENARARSCFRGLPSEGDARNPSIGRRPSLSPAKLTIPPAGDGASQANSTAGAGDALTGTEPRRTEVLVTRSVLIVEDCESMAQLETVLVRMGAGQAVRAVDGQEALAALRQDPYDLILLDLTLPRLDGQALLDHLWADPRLRQIPVIIVSGDLDRLRRTPQVVAVIAKPFAAAELLARIRVALDRRAEADRRSNGSDRRKPGP